MFCVECGAEGKVYESLCEKCFLEKHKLAELSDFLDIEMCKECGAFLVGSKWVKEPLERVVDMILDRAISFEKIVDNSHFSVEYFPEDEMNYSIVVTCDMFVDDLRTAKELQSKVRLKPSQCVVCTRKKSHYYEAVLQVRADTRNLSKEEKDAVYRFVHERVDATSEAFISEEEEMHGGWDFHLSSKALARNLSKDLASMYCAQESSSAKLVGMKDGQDLHRVTHSVRLPQYEVGDVIKHRGVLYQIIKMASTVTAVNIENWKSHSFPPSELVESTVEDCFRLQAIVLAQTEDEMQIMDPDTMKTVTIKKPEGFQPEGEEISIIKCEKGIFASPTQKN